MFISSHIQTIYLKIKKFLPIVLIVSIGVISTYLKTIHLHGSLVIDEMYTVLASKASVFSLAFGIHYDPSHPPFHYILYKAWIGLVGQNENSLRILPIIFDNMAYFSFAYITQKIIKNKYILISVCLLYTGSHLIFQISRYVRGYSLLLFLMITVIPVFYQFLIAKKNIYIWALWTFIISFIGIYTHYCFSMVLLYLFITFFLLFRNDTTIFKRGILFFLFLFFQYIPWLFIFIKYQVSPPRDWMPFLAHYQSRWEDNSQFIYALLSGFPIPEFTHRIEIIIASLFILLMLNIAFFLFKRSPKNSLQRFYLLFTLVATLLYFLTPIHTVFDLPRYSPFFIPIYLVIIGLAIHEFVSSSIYPLLLAMAVWISMTSWFNFPYNPPIQDWKSITRYVSSQYPENTPLIFETCVAAFGFRYYYTGNQARLYCFASDLKYSLPTWSPKNNMQVIVIEPTDERDSTLRFIETLYPNMYNRIKKIPFGDISVYEYQKNTTLQPDDIAEPQQYVQ